MLAQIERQLMEADGQPKGFHFLAAHEICRSPKPTLWLVKDILDAGSMCSWFGDSGSMKSFLSLDLGLSVAASLNAWHGQYIRLSGPVFNIVGEGFNGVNRRVKAWSLYHGLELETIPFFISDRPARFLDKEGTRELVQAVDEMATAHGNPVLIIIDTLNRNFGPGDENSTADMTRFIQSIDDSLRNRYHCAVLIIHHSGLAANDRARGASALRASLDWEYKLQKNSDGSRTLTCTKAKDHAEPAPMYFMPREIRIEDWIDPDDGEVMTSCVMNRIDEVPAIIKPLAGAQKVALDALISSGKCAHIDVWRKAAYSSGISPASSPEAKKKAFQRAVTNLHTGGYVETKDDYWWISGTRDINGTLSGHVPEQ